MRARMRIGALLLGLVCLFGAAEARAAPVCSNTPGANDRVVCEESGATDIDIDLTNPAIATSVATEHGVHARHTNTGTGGIDINVAGGSISATGSGGDGLRFQQLGTGGASVVLERGVKVTGAAYGVYGEVASTANGATISFNAMGGSVSATSGRAISVLSRGTGGVDVDLADVAVSTTGFDGFGVHAEHTGAGGTGVDIDITGGSVSTTDATGVYGDVRTDSGGTASIDMRDVIVSTEGSNAHGVHGLVRNVAGRAVSIAVTGGRISTKDGVAHGIFGQVWRTASTAPISIDAKDVDISTTGVNAHGVYANNRGAGAVDVDLKGGSISAAGVGVFVWHDGAGGIDVDLADIAIATTAETNGYGVLGYANGAGEKALSIDVTRGRIVTVGTRSYGVIAANVHATSEATVSIGGTGGAIATAGANAYGVYARHDGMGRIGVELADVDIATTGADAHGVQGLMNNSGNGSALSIDVAGGNIAAAGLGARGIFGYHPGLGSVSMTTGAAGTVEAPFAVGMEGRLTNDASAAGRLLLTQKGAIKAREVGVLAWAARSSGHTMGAGATTADDAARTMPMVHVTSSGDITVGAAATDAFIADRIAGADGTLSAGENAVLAAIAADDSAALDRALDALPAAYDDDYRTEARALLARRGHEASSASDLAHLAAGRILDLSRAGVRALAISHTAIADHVRNGDRDPAILAIAEATRTDEQQATLAEQGKLSAGERTVLEAALEGSGLETALTALTGAAYTDDWKNEVRRLAASYNAGDIQVDVTGGSITAEGNGVEALYAVPHDSNGAIAVSVAEGASVAGGANGLYVRGAGATGGVRSQRVTVNGAVTGGTGAGVRMIDGGWLEVGKTGRIGATSGVGVLSDGAGDLRATVEGTVEGDVRIRGGGALRLDVREGGAVTGTVRDPVGPLTVAGSIGRVLYSSGGAVTVTRTGALTGVEADGKIEALRSESGDLSLTVADMGMVTGDVQARGGGRLTLDLKQGGTISGTVHDPVSPLDPVGPLTVVGSIGRVLYSSGGAVTVTGTGRLTGVEVGGGTEALGSESGALRLTVANKGMVTGDVQARGDDGRLTLDLKEGGTISGTVHDPVGPLTVVGSIGRLLYSSGGAVTVTGTGRLTGVEVDGGTEALGSESGALSLTVADKGVVTGDVQARGDDGRLTLDLKQGGTISGTVHDPVGPLTVVGSIGRLLYSSGGAVTVARTGRLTGVGGVALRSEAGNLDLTVAGMATGDIDARGDGDLTVSVSGTVDGDIFGRGAGEHTVTVARGGSITGTVDLGASAVTADGAVGRVLLRRGGETTVGATGRLTGVDGVAVRSDSGDLGVTVAAMGLATGDIDGRGAGDLTVLVAGTVDGDVFGRGAGEHAVTVAPGGEITGTVRLDGDGVVIVEGMAGRIDFERDGRVTVGPEGRISGRDGVSIKSSSGAPAVTIVPTAGELCVDAEKRVRGSILPEPAGGEINCDDGAAPGPAAHTRVYEALPSVLLGMERLSSHADRTAAPRGSNGAWARVDASRGSWEAAKSANAGTAYDHRGFSFQAGVDAVLGEETRAGLSVHWRRATAEVSQGGEIEARGAGVGLSATWSPGPFFVDGQAAATLYDVDLDSSLRGRLKDDVGAQGLSAALEAGRMVPVADGVTVTPRARVAYSSLSLSDFVDDAAGARVSLDRGRSLTGRAGALAERVFGEGGRLFGSVDVEREFSAETRMSVAGTSLETTGEETRYMVGVGGEHGWKEGRFMLRGALGYAASGGGARDYGGRASLSMRF